LYVVTVITASQTLAVEFCVKAGRSASEHCKWFRIRLAVARSVDPKLTDARRGRPSTAPTDEDIESCSWPAHWRPSSLRQKDCRMLKRQQIYRLRSCGAKCLEKCANNFYWFVNDGAETGRECFLTRFLSMAENGGKNRYSERPWCFVYCLATKWQYGVDGKKFAEIENRAVQNISRVNTILITLSTQKVYSSENALQRTKILMQHITEKFRIGLPCIGRDWFCLFTVYYHNTCDW